MMLQLSINKFCGFTLMGSFFSLFFLFVFLFFCNMHIIYKVPRTSFARICINVRLS